MTEIYRCENKFGHGPYGNSADGSRFNNFEELQEYLPWIIQHNDVDGKHPIPDMDGIELGGDIYGNPTPYGWQCGFADLKQVHSWFTPFQRRDLLEKGFLFVLLSTDDEIKFGRYQCVFHRPKATLIRPLTYKEIFPHETETRVGR